MGRKLVFTNSRGGVIEFENSPYMILKLDGLGTPGTSLQEQKAPDQDGTTYIGNLLQSRTIVLELGIIKKAVVDIDTARRDIIAKLNPKMGMGDLVYTTTGGSQYRIKCVPLSSPNIPNQDYRDPFLRVQISLYAPDPMWKEMTDETVSLPTSVNSAESVINGAVTSRSSIIQLANGNLFVAYVRGSDGYLVSRTYTTSWSSESIINGSSTTFVSIIQLENGNLFVVYTRSSDNFIVSRTFTSSWSGETVINSAVSSYSRVIQLLNGDLFLVYQNYDPNPANRYIVYRVYTSSWSSALAVDTNGSESPDIVQLTNGDVFCFYRRYSDGAMVSKTLRGTTWGSLSVVSSYGGSYGNSILKLKNGSLLAAYINFNSDLVYKIYKTTWSSDSVVTSGWSATYTSAIQLENGSLFFLYRRVTDSFLVSKTRSVTSVPVTITGDVNSPILVTMNGPATNPRIINENTLEYIRLNTTLTASDSFVVDTSFGQKTVTLTQGGITKNGIAFLDIGSTFFSLTPGSNTVYLEDDSELSTATASMVYTNRYVGV